MKLASRSAIESDNSAKAGSSRSSGKAEEVLPPGVKVWLSRSDVRELARRGVLGLDGGRLRDEERLVVLFSIFSDNRFRVERCT